MSDTYLDLDFLRTLQEHMARRALDAEEANMLIRESGCRPPDESKSDDDAQ